MKRSVDILISVVGLILLSPLFAIVAALIKAEDKGCVFFRQERIGKHFRPFTIYKFRTMVEGAPRLGPGLTVAGDRRITTVGRFLRRTKIDELPQLINVLRGEMSLVGPRPEIPRYVDLFREDFEQILRVRPGITDAASIKYRDEASLLARTSDPEVEYLQNILPEKIALAKEYLTKASFGYDARLVLSTVFRLFHPGNGGGPPRAGSDRPSQHMESQ